MNKEERLNNEAPALESEATEEVVAGDEVTIVNEDGTEEDVVVAEVVSEDEAPQETPAEA